MKTKASRRILLAVLALALLCGTAAAASEVTKTLTAYYSGIRIVLNGVEVTPKDAAGNVVEPFIADGTTYLPVRAIANAMGLPVEWDGENRIVYLGEIPGQAENWMTKLPPYQLVKATAYDGSDPKQSFSVGGATQIMGVTFNGFRQTYDTASAIWNTNGKYRSMTLTVGHMGNDEYDAKMEVYLDGVYSTEYELKYDAAPRTITIPLDYAPNVRLQFVKVTNTNYGSTQYGIYDISFE